MFRFSANKSKFLKELYNVFTEITESTQGNVCNVVVLFTLNTFPMQAILELCNCAFYSITFREVVPFTDNCPK